MKIRVYATPREVTDEDLRDSTAVVVDVLRASSTIITALENGAREVVPVATPAEAAELASKAGRANTLLGGEREGKMIEGFDLGNSPLEYASDKVSGRSIIFASTNGAPAIVRSKQAEDAIIASFNNHSAAVRFLRSAGRDVSIVCSGRYGKFSLEDFVYAGKLVEGLNGNGGGEVSNDGSLAALELFHRYRSQLPELVRSCLHGRYLAQIGFDSDLNYCARVDSHDSVPILIEGKLRLAKSNGKSR
ncbi:2-phosphosulfolactate phosphatase [bacterium]|nr:2-phosphosulfolactate phosphatase [bacterium]